MRITTNFSDAARPNVALVAGALWLILIACSGMGAWIVTDTAALREDLPGLRKWAARLNQPAKSAAGEANAMQNSALIAARERLARINAISQTRGASTAAVLAMLETLLPDDVWLSSLTHRARDGELLLVVDAAGADPLAKFLRRLEGQPMFGEVLLTRQTQPTSDGPSGLRSEIRVKVKP